MKRKLIAVVIVLAMVVSMVVPALAYDDEGYFDSAWDLQDALDMAATEAPYTLIFSSGTVSLGRSGLVIPENVTFLITREAVLEIGADRVDNKGTIRLREEAQLVFIEGSEIHNESGATLDLSGGDVVLDIDPEFEGFLLFNYGFLILAYSEQLADLTDGDGTTVVFSDPADYSAVNDAIAAFEALDLGLYTDDSWEALSTAVASVVRGLLAPEQPRVDGYAIAIFTAIEELVLRALPPLNVANITQLREGILDPNGPTVFIIPNWLGWAANLPAIEVTREVTLIGVAQYSTIQHNSGVINNTRHFIIRESGSLTLENISLQGWTGNPSRGGIEVNGGKLFMESSRIWNCENTNTVSAAAIFVDGGYVEINNSLIDQNRMGGNQSNRAGAILVQGNAEVIISNTEFIGNRANSASASLNVSPSIASRAPAKVWFGENVTFSNGGNIANEFNAAGNGINNWNRNEEIGPRNLLSNRCVHGDFEPECLICNPPVPADYTALNAAIAAANAINRDWNSEESIAVLNTAVAAVTYGLLIEDQERVDAYTAAIIAAITALDRIPVQVGTTNALKTAVEDPNGPYEILVSSISWQSSTTPIMVSRAVTISTAIPGVEALITMVPSPPVASNSRHFVVIDGGELTLNGLVLQGRTSSQLCGGITVRTGGKLFINNTRISFGGGIMQGETLRGGGLYVDGGYVEINDSEFYSCYVGGTNGFRAGALLAIGYSEVIIRNTVFDSNHVQNPSQHPQILANPSIIAQSPAKIWFEDVTFVRGTGATGPNYNTRGNGINAWNDVDDFESWNLLINRCDCGEYKYSSEGVVTLPTCTTDGFTMYTCSCGEEYIVNEVPSLGHTYVSAFTPPTCLTDGFTTYTCTRCSDTYDDDIVPALGHDYVATITDPLCLEDGFTTYVCTRCNNTYVDDIVPKLGHNYVGTVTDPLCLEDGFTTYVCTRCEDTYVDDIVPALGHDYVATVTDPTCVDDGFTTNVCSRCDDTYIDEIVPAFGHTEGWRVRTEENVWELYCETCGVMYEVLTIESAVAVFVGPSSISFAPVPRNSKVQTLIFQVEETLSDGSVEIVDYAIDITANNRNIDGFINLGVYSLFFDIKGDGSNIKLFEIVMNP